VLEGAVLEGAVLEGAVPESAVPAPELASVPPGRVGFGAVRPTGLPLAEEPGVAARGALPGVPSAGTGATPPGCPGYVSGSWRSARTGLLHDSIVFVCDEYVMASNSISAAALSCVLLPVVEWPSWPPEDSCAPSEPCAPWAPCALGAPVIPPLQPPPRAQPPPGVQPLPGVQPPPRGKPSPSVFIARSVPGFSSASICGLILFSDSPAFRIATET
jgi:hypothetical protein